MKNVLFKLKARFEFCETVAFDPFTDLSAEYFINNIDQDEGLPPAVAIESVDYEKLSETPPVLEKWTDEEAILHGIFGRTQQTLVSQKWNVLCKISLPTDCNLEHVGILFGPNPGTEIESTFNYEIESQTTV